MNKYKLQIGDWSEDGHSKHDDVIFTTNKTALEIRQAYWDSCINTGVAFHHSDMQTMDAYNGISKDLDCSKIKHRILCEYGESYINKNVVDIFTGYGMSQDDIFEDYSDDEGNLSVFDQNTFSKLIFWFISLSLEGFEYSIVEDGLEVINGDWDKDLNVQFGYGIYE